jgi:hypothetical protein
MSSSVQIDPSEVFRFVIGVHFDPIPPIPPRYERLMRSDEPNKRRTPANVGRSTDKNVDIRIIFGPNFVF